MDRHPALNDDAALEREIAQALAVDPSPEFLPRVRTRIASEAPPAAWRLPWTWVAAGAMAAVVVFAVVLARSNLSETFEGGSRPVLDARTFADLSAPLPSSDRRVPPLASVRRPESGRAEPEILIDAREATALSALLSGVRGRRIDLTALARERSNAATAGTGSNEITIQPIVIAAIPFVPSTEGVRQ